MTHNQQLALPEAGFTRLDIVLSARLDELQLPPRALNAYTNAGIRYLGQLVTQDPSGLFKLPNFGRTSLVKTQKQLDALDLSFGMDIASWDVMSAATIRNSHISDVRKIIALSAGKLKEHYERLEDEFAAILDVLAEGRAKKIIGKYWGICGHPPRTLESVGNEYGITRERVRQIAQKAQDKAATIWLPTTRLRAVLRGFEKNCPLPRADATRLISEISRSGSIAPDSILNAAEIFGVPHSCVLVSDANTEFVDRIGRTPSVHEVVLDFRKATSSSGCINIDRMSLRLTGELKDGSTIRKILDGLPETIWLDDAKRWASSNLPLRNRLGNIIGKILSVCEELHISELRQAALRPHRISFVPPQPILLAFANRVCRHVTNGSVVKRGEGVELPILGKLEQIFLDCFHKFGSPLQREVIEEYCIDALGVNVSSFYVYLCYSAIVQKLSTGVFALVGNDLPIGSVEEMAEERRLLARTEHGWDAAGRLWYATRLDRVKMRMGMFYLPSFVLSLTQGTWLSRLPDGTITGELPVQENGISGLRELLELSGAERGDVMRLSFELPKNFLEIEVGGEELFDAGHSTTIDVDTFSEEE